MTDINTGLASNARKAAAEALRELLADTYALYLKTHAYHWNVSGPYFEQLHVMFESQYRDMWAALDDLAERIRALGEFAPQSSAQMIELTKIEADGPTPPSAGEMVKNLLAGHEKLIRRARKALDATAEAGDAVSEDLVTQRLAAHEKTAWMLRATAA